jgi:hypothetical protein
VLKKSSLFPDIHIHLYLHIQQQQEKLNLCKQLQVHVGKKKSGKELGSAVQRYIQLGRLRNY